MSPCASCPFVSSAARRRRAARNSCQAHPMRLPMVLIPVFCLGACSRQSAPPPKLPPITGISARIHAVPEWINPPIDSVEVPQEDVPAFAVLITPAEPCVQTIDPTIHYHVADVVVRHPDGS